MRKILDAIEACDIILERLGKQLSAKKLFSEEYNDIQDSINIYLEYKDTLIIELLSNEDFKEVLRFAKEKAKNELGR